MTNEKNRKVRIFCSETVAKRKFTKKPYILETPLSTPLIQKNVQIPVKNTGKNTGKNKPLELTTFLYKMAK